MEIGKVENEKALNYHKQKVTKKFVQENLQSKLSLTQHWHIQNPVKNLRWSPLRTWLSTSASS